MNANSHKGLEWEVQAQFGAPMSKRYLHSLPGFRLDPALPARFRDLLAKIEQAEQERANHSSQPPT